MVDPTVDIDNASNAPDIVEEVTADDILDTEIKKVVNDDDITDPIVLEVEEEAPTHMEIPPAFRKTSRVTKPSVWIQDYVIPKKTSKTSLYLLSSYLSYDHLSPSYQSYVTAFSTLVEPQYFKKSSQDKRQITLM